ncbi:MAG: metalloregulator ArsR/SmtB family transcription factor [Thermoanaerobaculia bacterium]|nr:metalloregulator ArsR/SmtB family transcription factor [Thermoanaerobaculia bacterium]
MQKATPIETAGPDPEGIDRIVERLKAMAEPTRLRILYQLRDDPELCVGEITERIGCTQANVSKHLRVLKSAGLVKRRREGMNVYYGLDCDSIFDVCTLICRRDEA